MRHLLEHVLGYVLKHVLVRHVPEHVLGHVPRHMLKQVLEHVPLNRQPDPPSCSQPSMLHHRQITVMQHVWSGYCWLQTTALLDLLPAMQGQRLVGCQHSARSLHTNLITSFSGHLWNKWIQHLNVRTLLGDPGLCRHYITVKCLSVTKCDAVYDFTLFLFFFFK